MKRHIPNAITCLNLFSGCLGIVWAFEHQLIWAGYAIAISAIFDFLDGLVARLLKAHSTIGKELDSLADVVSFGVLPSVIAFQLLKDAQPANDLLPYTAFIIAVFSALRLAKFNVDTRQSEQFIGLPTPANALLWGSLPFINTAPGEALTALHTPWKIVALVLFMSSLLVAELPLMALKFKTWGIKGNEFKYVLIFLAILFLFMLKFAAIPLIIGLYISLSIIQNQFKK